MAKRRKIYPMPVESIYDSAAFARLPAAGAGMLFRLMLHYWFTGCQPMPIADHELRAICRAHTATWVSVKKHVLDLFNELRPAMDRYFYERENKLTTIKMNFSKGNANRRAESLANKVRAQRAQLGDTPATAARLPRPAESVAKPAQVEEPAWLTD